MTTLTKYKQVIIAGFGPYCFSSHLKTILKYNIKIPLVIEVEDQIQRAREILNALSFESTEIISIPSKNKYDSFPPELICKLIQEKIKTLTETLFIISSEPQGHLMWMNFALETNFDIFVDKPVIVEKNISIEKTIAEKVSIEISTLITKQKNRKSGKTFIGIDRPFTPVGKDIFNWITENHKKSHSINYISINYCFGEGSTLAEQQTKENHPYKHGYGILYHSGLHLIDMLARFLRLGLSSDFNFKIKSSTLNVPNIDHAGETDFCGVFTAEPTNQSPGKTIGMIHLSSLGFTRRSDFVTEIKNPYHQLNKVRSERYEIHMGHHKKMIYTGHNSGEASNEDRIEQIEFFDSSLDRVFDYQKLDYTNNKTKTTALENVLTNPEAVVLLEEIELSQKILHECTISISK